MSQSPDQNWQALAATHRIDPVEVQVVHERYAAHRRYAASGQGEPIALADWFRFYHLEKSSEGEQAGPAPGSFGADSDTINNACLKRPREFLEVLLAYDAAAAESE
ncbi:MAG: hypothetical protein QNJ73_09135 [Gammaproteobacteria bacterium]|nr:hypothetical protein [Gammaproteobacteria bacterium]